MRRLILIFALLLDLAPALGADVQFEFSGWAGPAIQVRMFVPESAAPDAPIVVVMHGNSRDVVRYYSDWREQGTGHGFIVVVPEFDAERFPGAAHYNLGHVFNPETGEPRPEELWTYSAIEPLFDEVVRRTGSTKDSYTLYGHSAGSQFVHRFLFHKINARVNRAIAANAGWYTMPDRGIDWPYGLRRSAVTDAAIGHALASDVIVLLGNADTDRADRNLRKTPEAELQGAHRYDRGHTFFRVARALAKQLGTEFAWSLQSVAGAAHSNAQMAPAAAKLVR